MKKIENGINSVRNLIIQRYKFDVQSLLKGLFNLNMMQIEKSHKCNARRSLEPAVETLAYDDLVESFHVCFPIQLGSRGSSIFMVDLPDVMS